MEKEINVKKDIIFGELGEDITDCVMSEEHGLVLKGRNKDYKGDLIYENLLVEVKTDKLSLEILDPIDKKIKRFCWNLLIEFNWKGKDSGIKTTESDIWVYYFIQTGEFWEISTEDLKELIRVNDFNEVWGGDNKSSKSYQIPKENFRKYFTIFTRTDEWLISKGYPISSEIVKLTNEESKD